VRRYNWEADERRLLGAIRMVADPIAARHEQRLTTPAPSTPGRDC